MWSVLNIIESAMMVSGRTTAVEQSRRSAAERRPGVGARCATSPPLALPAQ